MTNKNIFINLPVKDLDKSIEFFTKLGYSFNPQFTDENATCMIINDTIFAMLLTEPFFKTFISPKEIANAHTSTEVLLGLSAESREEVDTFFQKAILAGAKETKTYDHGFMYGKDFEDLDGHIWEIFWMDPKHIN